jgi:hypothetical protein
VLASKDSKLPLVAVSVFFAGADGSLSLKPDAPWFPLCTAAQPI